MILATEQEAQPKTFYRYVSVRYAPPYDYFNDEPGPGLGRLVVELRKYRVIKVTPCGVRLCNGRFVNTQRRKQFAHATESGALEAFIARTECYASILEKRLDDAREALLMAQKLEQES